MKDVVENHKANHELGTLRCVNERTGECVAFVTLIFLELHDECCNDFEYSVDCCPTRKPTSRHQANHL